MTVLRARSGSPEILLRNTETDVIDEASDVLDVGGTCLSIQAIDKLIEESRDNTQRRLECRRQEAVQGSDSVHQTLELCDSRGGTIEK